MDSVTLSTHRFAANFWGDGDQGYQVLLERMKSSKQILQSLQLLFQARADSEDQMGKTLLKQAKTSSNLANSTGNTDDEGYGLRKVVDSLRWELLQASQQRLSLAEDIRQKLIKPMEDILKMHHDIKQHKQSSMDKVVKQRNQAQQFASKSEEKYRQKCIELENLNAQLINLEGQARDLSGPAGVKAMKEKDKLEGKIQKATQNRNGADQEYQVAIERLHEIHQIWVKEMTDLCNDFQKIVEERSTFVKDSIKIYAEICSKIASSEVESNERSLNSTESVDKDQDVRVIIRLYATGSDIPDPISYRNYYDASSGLASGAPAPKTYTPAAGKVVTESPALTKKESNPVSKEPSPDKVLSLNDGAIGLQSNKPSRRATISGDTKISKPAQKSGDTSSARGAVSARQSISVDPGSLLAEKKVPDSPNPGRSSRSASLSRPTSGYSTTTASLSRTASRKDYQAQVLYNYDALKADELTVDAGQTVKIKREIEDGWFMAELKIGKEVLVGKIPGSIFTKI